MKMFILIFVCSVVLAAVVGFLAGIGWGQGREHYTVLAWLRETEASARANPTAMHVVELPGYQGIIRLFRLRFDL